MWSRSLLSYLPLVIIGFAFTYILLSVSIAGTKTSCVVVVTGESIHIEGCAFTPEFIEYAKTLTIPNIW